ncbi:MAG: multiheme c-type cytochrome [Polyangiaceae bacterium]
MPRSFLSFVMHHFAWAAPILGLGVAASEGCKTASAPDVETRAVAADVGPPTLRLYLVSDMAGALEPCGCTKDQLGGLDHFGAWFKSATPAGLTQFVASAGPLFFMDPIVSPSHADQDRAKADTIADVLRGLDFVAFAPGVNDWAEGSDRLTRLARASGGVGLTDGRSSKEFSSAVVREVAGGGMRVGFVGYGQPPVGEHLADPIEVTRRGVEQAKAEGANVLVALVAVGRGEAKRIADAVPELTAVVVGSSKSTGEGNTTSPQAERIGDVIVVQTANHLQTVAVLDLYVREGAAPGRVMAFADATGLELASRREELTTRIDDLHVRIAAWERDRSVGPKDLEARRRDLARLEAERGALDAKPAPGRGNFFRYAVREIRPSLGEDAAIETAMRTYYKVVDDHNRVQFADRQPPPAGPHDATYVGVERCTMCHPAARQVWDRTRHAAAYQALVPQFKEFNLDCVSCHVTGYERPGGSTVTHVDGLRNVQCEVCHGPGSKHVEAPLDPSRIVAHPGPTVCLDCHHPPHVEGFDALAKLNDILGPGHGRPQ